MDKPLKLGSGMKVIPLKAPNTEERRLVGILRGLWMSGFRPCYVDDGEERTRLDPWAKAFIGTTIEEVADLAHATDEVRIGFQGAGDARGWLFVVWGNGPEDLIADWLDVEPFTTAAARRMV